MPTILIQNARIFDGEAFSHGDLLLADGRIREISDHIDTPARVRFDAAGKTVLPGLVDIHTHLRGPSPDWLGAPAQAGCFPFGVTAAADCSALEDHREAVALMGIDAVVFPIAGTKNDTASLENATAHLDHYGPYAGGIKVFFDTHDDPTLHSPKPLREICDFAHSRGLPVMVHTNGTPIPMAELLTTLGPGDICSHTYHGGANTLRDSGYACIQAAKDRGVVIDTGFAGSYHVDFSIFAEAIAAGAGPDTVSTDLTINNLFNAGGGRYGMTMAMSMARAAGMSEEAVFRAVTSTPAAALKKPWGRLCVDGPADLCVLSWGPEPWSLTDRAGNHLSSDQSYRCHLTIKNGTIVHRTPDIP